MFFEYIQLTGMGGASFSLDFLSRVLFLVVAGLVLAVVGFKIKGVWGGSWLGCGGRLVFVQ